MKTEIPGPLVHFFGFHMFFYVIGMSVLSWFHLHFSTEVGGEPLRLTLRYGWPLAFLLYLPVAMYLFRLSPIKPANSRRLTRYILGICLASFLTAVSSAGYLGLSYLAGRSNPPAVAILTRPAVHEDTFAVYQVTSQVAVANPGPSQFRGPGARQQKHLEIFQGWTGVYFWADRKF